MIKFTTKDGNIPNEVQSNSLLSLSVYMRIKEFLLSGIVGVAKN